MRIGLACFASFAKLNRAHLCFACFATLSTFRLRISELHYACFASLDMAHFCSACFAQLHCLTFATLCLLHFTSLNVSILGCACLTMLHSALLFWAAPASTDLLGFFPNTREFFDVLIFVLNALELSQGIVEQDFTQFWTWKDIVQLAISSSLPRSINAQRDYLALALRVHDMERYEPTNLPYAMLIRRLAIVPLKRPVQI